MSDARINSLASHFVQLGLPHDAAAFLLMLWQAAQTIDDVADGDPVSHKDLRLTSWNLLVALHMNRFWREHQDSIVPLMAVVLLKWIASDDVERAGAADARSFGWRAGFYDITLLVVQICRGPEFAMGAAADVLRLYGESLDEYLKEYRNA